MAGTGSRWRDPWVWAAGGAGALAAALGFPPAGLWPIPVLGVSALWAGCVARPDRTPFSAGWAWGVGYFGALLWWLVPTVVRYGGLGWMPGAACIGLLVAYLALYPALMSAVLGLAARRSLSGALVLAPLAWTAAEGLRGRLLTGFPWGDLPQALWRVGPALDLAPWVGADGVRLLLAALGVAPAWALTCLLRRERPSPWPLIVPLAAGALWAALAAAPLPLSPPEGRIRVGVAQGNIDQAQKWDPAYRDATLRIYGDLTRALANQGARLVLWPETAAPFYAQDRTPERVRLESLVRAEQVWLLFGAPGYVRTPGGVEYRNAVLLMDPAGRLRGRYDKVHLVPFGEYVPLGRFLPFVRKLVQGAGDFRPGDGIRPLRVPDLPALGPLVCFEAIFPGLAAQHAAQGAQVLVVLTNDGWFGQTPGPAQHLAFSAWRAAENGLPLVRAANTGISAVFDRRGRLVQATPLGVRMQFSADVEYPRPGATPQALVRPWIAPACGVLVAGGLFAILRRPRRMASQTQPPNLHRYDPEE